MSKADTWEFGLLDLLFLNTAFTNVGDAGGLLPSATVGSLFLSLHTADPGEAGDQTTNETSYTSYARVAVARSAGGFTRTGSSISPTANVDFPAATGGTATITHFGIGTASAAAGKLLYKGTVTPNIAVSSGVIPRLTTASTVAED